MLLWNLLAWRIERDIDLTSSQEGSSSAFAIARALVADPELVVCDEPTGDLDRSNAEQILSLLQTLNREQGKLIVMVTHDPVAADYASRKVHLDKGKVLADLPV